MLLNKLQVGDQVLEEHNKGCFKYLVIENHGRAAENNPHVVRCDLSILIVQYDLPHLTKLAEMGLQTISWCDDIYSGDFLLLESRRVHILRDGKVIFDSGDV